MHRDPLPLWPLPLLVALVPFVAAHLAYAISIDAGHVPACMPYVEGCTSISRAARHGLGNIVFRLLMLPCALLLTLHWLAARRWLRLSHADTRAGRSLLWLAPVSGLALARYLAFLGTDGEIYPLLRQYGAQLYFASAYIAQLVFFRRYREIIGRYDGIGRALLVISVAMLLLGLAYTATANTLADATLKDRLENLLEWQIGLLMSAWYL